MRRSSPEEDYILTLTGVKNLIEQQQKIVEEIKKWDDEVNRNKSENDSFNMSAKCDVKKFQKSQISEIQNNVTANSLVNVTNDLTRSSSSSMQTLRRILEIEEWRRFSEILDLRLETMFSVSK